MLDLRLQPAFFLMAPRSLAAVALAVCLVGPTHEAEGNSIEAAPDPAMNGSTFGLQITLDDPAQTPPADAWVAIGPEKGLLAETAVDGSFLIDPTALAMEPGTDPLPFLTFYEQFDAAGARLTFFLSRQGDGTWALGAWIWDASAGEFLVAGPAFLAPDCGATPTAPECVPLPPGSTRLDVGPASPILVEFEWAAQGYDGPGFLRTYRRPFQPGAQESLMFEATGLANEAQSLSYLRLGVQGSQHPAGTYGTLYLDEVALYRRPQGTGLTPDTPAVGHTPPQAGPHPVPPSRRRAEPPLPPSGEGRVWEREPGTGAGDVWKIERERTRERPNPRPKPQREGSTHSSQSGSDHASRYAGQIRGQERPRPQTVRSGIRAARLALQARADLFDLGPVEPVVASEGQMAG